MYVGISTQLLDEVAGHTQRMRKAEQASLPKQDYLLTGNESWLLAAVWGKYLPLKDQMPKEWKGSTGTFTLGGVVYKDVALATMNIRLEKALQLPPSSGYGVPRVQINKNSQPDVTQDPNVVKILEIELQHTELDARWAKVRDELQKFLNSCKSLNEAIKLWPQIEMYIPADYLQRVEDKRVVNKEASKAAEVLKDLDTDGLTAAAVTARMSGHTK